MESHSEVIGRIPLLPPPAVLLLVLVGVLELRVTLLQPLPLCRHQ